MRSFYCLLGRSGVHNWCPAVHVRDVDMWQLTRSAHQLPHQLTVGIYKCVRSPLLRMERSLWVSQQSIGQPCTSSTVLLHHLPQTALPNFDDQCSS